MRNSLGRLLALLELLNQYGDIKQDQLKQGIVEKASNEPVGKEFYLPHRPVI